jgi:hypothetical protein
VRTNSVIHTLAVLAIRAQNLVAGRIVVGVDMPVRDVASGGLPTTNCAAVLSTIVSDVVERQEKSLRFTTARTPEASVGFEHSFLDDRAFPFPVIAIPGARLIEPLQPIRLRAQSKASFAL